MMRSLANPRVRDYIGGLLMMVLGAGTIVQGAQYSIGTLSRMGPGYFPIALGVILFLTGGIIVIVGKLAAPRPEDEPVRPEWRGWACIALGVIAFGVLGKYAGLIPATFGIVFVSALGDRQNTIRSALLLAALMIVFCVVVFVWGLQIQLPMFGSGV